jgi:16S rRNA C1402 N4-methylase RsmH
MGKSGISAENVLNEYTEEALLKILVDYGGEKYMAAKRIVGEKRCKLCN